MPRTEFKLSVKQADVLTFYCDVVLLKFAQSWHGADLSVSWKLQLGKGYDSHGSYLAPGEYRFLDTANQLNARHVLIEGVPPLNEINYARIREFCKRSLIHLNQACPQAKHIAMTMHGANFGMDEKESFLSQIAGVLEALSQRDFLPQLEEITFIELNEARAKRMAAILEENYSNKPKPEQKQVQASVIAKAGLQNTERPHIFVAMPFSPEMEDVFIFGIQGPVQEAGFLCERVDMAIFTGDIIERIKSRIETAALVIADLTGANANVYLEVGYA
ncbi:MAG: hypothetical protein K2X81_02410, partial [Candidatus Obscuribacterales bacterium]|nr:hypothetical protein [Candidatus Obscuribacterales bacterium]